jgi:hypothetical protein
MRWLLSEGRGSVVAQEVAAVRGLHAKTTTRTALDHLVGAGEELWRHVEAQRLS